METLAVSSSSSWWSMFSALNVGVALLAVMLLMVLRSYLAFQIARRKALPLPSAPAYWPVGSLHLYKDGVVRALDKLKNIVSKDGVFTMWAFDTEVVMITHHEHVKAVLSSSVSRKPIPGLAEHLTHFLGEHSLVHLMGEEWKWHRKIMFQAFKFAQLQSMAQDMKVCIENLFTYLDTVPADHAFDLQPVLKALTFDVIGVTAFGYDMKSVDSLKSGRVLDVAAAFEFLLSEHGRRHSSVNPMDTRYWVPTATNRKHAHCRQVLKSALHNIINHRYEARARGEETHQDFLAYMLDAFTSTETSNADAKEIMIDNLVTLMFAGFDTTSLTLTFALSLLISHPQVLSKLQEEVDRVLQNDPVEFKHQAQLKYTTMVIKETLRLLPPAPLTARLSTQDLQLSNVTVPAGTPIWIPIHLVHRSRHNYYDPDRFWPERWEKNMSFDPAPASSAVSAGGSGASKLSVASTPSNSVAAVYDSEEVSSKQLQSEDAKPDDRIPNFAWIPFSGGQRDCLGFRFGMLESTLALAALIRRYRFKLAPGFTFEMGPASVLQTTKAGLRVLCERR